MTRSLLLGLVGSTLVFLSAVGGMVSLAQLLIYGVAGFVIGNSVAEVGSKGLKLGLNPWVAVVAAIVIASTVALLLGVLSSRTFGIYFLMLTLTYSVIGYYVTGQIVEISGFGGITGIDPPAIFDGKVRLYYLALALSIFAYVLFKLIRRSPFGIALEGLRDDPIRMASLGFNVALHRALAFAMAGFVASLAGVVNVWWNGQIDPNTISLGATIDLLVIAVIGGIATIEGAWLGALVFVVANNYMRQLPFASSVGLTEARFNTVVGLLVLLIVVISPNGLMGLIEKMRSGRNSTKDQSGGQSTAQPTTPDQGVLANQS